MLLENDIDASQELAADRANGGAMMFALIAFGLVKGLEFGFLLNSHAGGLPEGVPQERGAPFTHMGFSGFELASLIDGGINTRISDEFFTVFEAVDIADLAQDGGPGDRADTRDRGDELRDLVHQVCDGLIDQLDLLQEQIQLIQKTLHFNIDRITEKANPN